MNSSNKTSGNTEKIVNKRSSDPFERLIFEKGLRIKQIMVDKNLNTMIVLLNNAHAIKVQISNFPALKKATQEELAQWELSGNGIGIRWNVLDEDLSLKGLIKESALASILNRLESKRDLQELSIL